MSLPPIRLIDYFVEHLDFDVHSHPDHQHDESVRAPFHNVRFEVEHSDPELEETDEQGNQFERMTFQVTIHLNKGPETPETACYRGAIRFAGLFNRVLRTTLDPSPSEEDYRLHSLASVIATLYPSAREYFHLLTAQSYFGKLILPSMSPYNVAKEMLDQPEVDSQ